MKRIATFGLLVLLVILLVVLPACTCHMVGDRVELDCWGDILPCANATYDLGSPTYWWEDAYIANLQVGNITGNYTDVVGYTFVVAASDAEDPSRADYVCDGTDDDVQINTAITAATTGGSVKLSEGNFSCRANVLLSENVTLVGQGMSTILTFTEKVVTNCIVIDGNAVQLRDMRIVAGAGCGAAGGRPNIVYAIGKDGLLLENLYLIGDNTVGNDTSALRQNGIYFSNVDESKITNCVTTSNVYSGIRLSNAADYNVISDSISYGNGKDGIVIDTSDDNTVESCHFYNNTERGIQLKDADNSSIGVCRCYSNTKSGIYMLGSDNNTLSGNFLISNGIHGLYLSGLNNRVVSNKAYNNSSDGINASGGGAIPSNYNSFIGNTCDANGDDGLDIEGGVNSNYNVVDGNILIGNTDKDYVDNGNQTKYWGGSTNVYLEIRPELDETLIRANGKPDAVTVGVYRGYSLPLYSANEELFFNICVPDRWNESSDIVIHLDCCLSQAEDTKNFNLELGWEHYTPGVDIIPATANLVPVQAATGATATQYQSYRLNFIIDYDIDGADTIIADDNLGLRIRRIDATANEIAGEVIVEHVGVVFIRDKVGVPVP